jgi:peptide/nickel transport system substrate-binding protein
MPGYFADNPHYTFDLSKCEEEFKASTLLSEDGQSVWDIGFRIQLTYNQGNTTRQNVMENLSDNLRYINENFHIETLGLPWPTFLDAQRAYQLPIMIAGWLEDIHDPHNWYQPYTQGTYAFRQSLPDDLKNQFNDILTRGIDELDPVKRAEIYREANQLYYSEAIGLPLVLTTSHTFEQRWVFGRIFNPIFPGTYYYSVYKQ